MAHRGLWYLNPYLSPATYGVVLAANMVSLLLGSVSMMSVARMKCQRAKTMCACSANTTRPAGWQRFCARHQKPVAGQPGAVQAPGRAAGRRPTRPGGSSLLRAAVAGEQRRLISHVEELYKSFKSNALSMRRCSLTVIVQGAVEGLQKKYPAARVETQLPEGLYVLADEAHLRAAITNLLVNGWEATVSAGKTEPSL